MKLNHFANSFETQSYVQRGSLLNCYGAVMNDLGKFLVVLGLALALIGALLWSGFGRSWLGRLPGDIHFARGNFNFYFPIVTCLLLSVLLTILLWLFRK
jgi:hypothetical protein